MVKEILIHIEGDNKKRKDTPVNLREGFSKFFKELREEGQKKGIKIRLLISGGRGDAYNDFSRF